MEFAAQQWADGEDIFAADGERGRSQRETVELIQAARKQLKKQKTLKLSRQAAGARRHCNSRSFR
jgi:hypothetical protein